MWFKFSLILLSLPLAVFAAESRGRLLPVTSSTTLPSASVLRTLGPFMTDGCSVQPDGELYKMERWQPCCIEHDKKYWAGGSEDMRTRADLDFRSCLADLGMNQFATMLWYNAIRMAGEPFLDFTWRWGYGWQPARPYSAFSAEEIKQLERYVPLLDLPIFIRLPPKWAELTYGDERECKPLVAAQLNNEKIKKDSLLLARLRSDTLSFQVFTTACSGGFFVMEFPNQPSKQTCQTINSTSEIKVRAFGECSRL